MKKILDFDEEDKIIDKIVKPYVLITKILSILLALSVLGNIYLSTKNVNITLNANKNEQSDINQEG